MDKYQIITQIGSGSFGVVCGALNEITGEVVAIKKLKMKINSVEQCMNLREIKALRKMNNHPNIIKLKEIIKEVDDLYLVFEYMEGSLYQRLIQTTFSEQEIRNLCFQIFLGLAHMHGNGYFHRDLKPENLLVFGDIVKIADLGLARETNGKPPYTDNVGTRWYQAPEVLLHAEVYDSSVDMWAMGVIMAELFTREPLFAGKSTVDQIYKICSVIGSSAENTADNNISYKFPELPGFSLSSVIPNASMEALNLIATLLSWRPCERPTALEALCHPFFYSCYRVPPPLLGYPIPLIFIMAQKREFEKEMKRASLKQTFISLKDCTLNIGSEREDPTDVLISRLPENPFSFMGFERRMDASENPMICFLPENPFDGSENCGMLFKMEMKRDSLKQKVSRKSCRDDLESDADHIENIAEVFMNKWDKNKSGKIELKFKRIRGKRLNF